MSLRRLTPPMLQARLAQAPAPLLLDVRRSEAFKRNPSGIAGAIPVLLDEATPGIPDLPRTTPRRTARWSEALAEASRYVILL